MISLNPRLLAILTLIGIVTCLLFPNLVYNTITSPLKEKINTDIAISCITDTLKDNPQMIKNIQNHPEIITALQKDNYTEIVKEVPVYITVTPTPDGLTYYAGEYQNGIRLLNHPWSLYWNNTLINYGISNGEMKASINIYDYAIFNKLYYKNLDKTNSPSGEGWELIPMANNEYNQMLIIFVTFETDELISNMSGDLLLPTSDMFRVEYNNIEYFPTETYPKQLQIEQIQYRKTEDNSMYIKYFGQTPYYVGIQTNKDTTSNDTAWQNNQVAGIASRPKYYSVKGKSNVEDGYIVYEIPKNINPENIIIKLDYYGYGYPSWILKNPYISQ